jgi:hypothetical protein
MKIKYVVVLEALRATKSVVPSPIEGKWKVLEEQLKYLFQEGMLELKNNTLMISQEGKKVLLLFNDKCKDLIAPFEGYKALTVNGNSIDARLPIAAYSVRDTLTKEVAFEYLSSLNPFLIWETFFSWVKALEAEGTEWQPLLLESFRMQSEYNVSVDSWKRLGYNEASAEIMGRTLTEPVTQITSL